MLASRKLCINQKESKREKRGCFCLCLLVCAVSQRLVCDLLYNNSRRIKRGGFLLLLLNCLKLAMNTTYMFFYKYIF